MSGDPAIVSIDTNVEGSGWDGSRTGSAAVTGMRHLTGADPRATGLGLRRTEAFRIAVRVVPHRQAGVNDFGPSLAGVVGRPAGQVPGFTYSGAMASSGSREL